MREMRKIKKRARRERERDSDVRVRLGTHAIVRFSCCLYTGPDARRRPSSSTTTHRIVMRDRDTRWVFPVAATGETEPLGAARSVVTRERNQLTFSLATLPCTLAVFFSLVSPSVFLLSCLRSVFVRVFRMHIRRFSFFPSYCCIIAPSLSLSLSLA